MEKKIKIHDEYNSQEDCNLGLHKAWLFVADESSIYSSSAENKYYARAICLNCGLEDSYQLSIGERRRCVYLPQGFDPYLCFSEVEERYSKLKSMYEPKENIEYERIVQRINFEIKKLYPAKYYDVEQQYGELKEMYRTSDEDIYYRMSLDIKKREAELINKLKSNFFRLKQSGLSDEEAFAQVEQERYESLQPDAPKDPSVLGLVRKK